MYPSILVSLSEVCFVTTKYSHNFWVPAGIQATHISHRAPPPGAGGYHLWVRVVWLSIFSPTYSHHQNIFILIRNLGNACISTDSITFQSWH